MNIAFPGVGLLELPLVGARVVGKISATGIADGVIGGAVRTEVLSSTVLPALATGMQELVSTCTGAAPDCCPDGSNEQNILDLFDENGDCTITQAEIETNNLISSLLSPDVDLFNAAGAFDPLNDGVKDSLSIGIGFTAVGAQFEAVVGAP